MASNRPDTCSIHGTRFRRESCRECNAAYMRAYLRNRRLRDPKAALLSRAKKRSQRLGLAYSLEATGVRFPGSCPVLGIELRVGGVRAAHSPSLDRIDPSLGYVPGNVRVISDRANRLKGDRTLEELEALASVADPSLRDDYLKTAKYVERERLLVEVRRRAELDDKGSEEWRKLADFLERAFCRLGETMR